MAVTDAYATAEEYRRALGRPDTNEDDEILVDLKAEARAIDREYRGDGRHFTRTASVEARIFYAAGPSRVIVDDIADAAGIIVKLDLNRDGVYELTLAAADFQLWPENATKGAEPRAFMQLRVPPSSRYAGVGWPQDVAFEVTAIYGWPAIPLAVKSLNIQRTALLRLETPRAVGEMPEGDTGAGDPSKGAQEKVVALCEPYRRHWMLEA